MFCRNGTNENNIFIVLFCYDFCTLLKKPLNDTLVVGVSGGNSRVVKIPYQFPLRQFSLMILGPLNYQQIFCLQKLGL